MELSDFIEKFRDQFDDPEAVALKPDTRFHELEEWNSLTGLMTIALADEEYGVTLLPNELKDAVTVKDLFDIIRSKQ